MDGADRIKGYATGLFEIARAEDELDRVESELFQVARALDGSEELRNALTDQAIPADRKKSIIHDLLGGRASNLTVAAIDFLVATGNGRELPKIADGSAHGPTSYTNSADGARCGTS